MDARKRWVTIAQRTGDRWRAAAPRPVHEPAALVRELTAGGAALALGLDLPLGLPRALVAALQAAGLAAPDFPAFLAAAAARPWFFEVNAELGTVSPERPFYPLRGLRGMTRAAHAAALGLAGPAGLSRWCDRATATRPAGASVLWTLGANQTGKAAITAWRDWLAPGLAGGAPLRLWPFQGGLHALLAPGVAVLAEVYPAEAMRHCGLKLAGSKRSQAARQALAPALLAAMAERRVVAEPALTAEVATGFGAHATGEDRFDSLVGLLGLVGVLDGARPDFVPDDPWVRQWEGWVLGQTDLPQLLTATPTA